jgi:hypothetical protein
LEVYMITFIFLLGCGSPATSYAEQRCQLLQDCELLSVYGYGTGEEALDSCLDEREEAAAKHGEPASAEACIESTALATCDALYGESEGECVEWLDEDSH